MPVRKKEVEEIDAAKEASKLEKLILLGANYASLKRDEKAIKASLTKQNAIIQELVKDYANCDINGYHREIHAPLGDGVNELFIQVQHRETVSLVGDIIQKIKDKLGVKKASNFLIVQEVLHDKAIESMLSQELINEKDVLDWTVVTGSKSLIVKIDKLKT